MLRDEPQCHHTVFFFYLQWMSNLANLFKALSKVHKQINMIKAFYSSTHISEDHILSALPQDLERASNRSTHLLCAMHDGLQTLHSHITGLDQSNSHWLLDHSNVTYHELKLLSTIQGQFGSDASQQRAFSYCGLIFSVNTMHHITREFTSILHQFQVW